MTSMNHSDIQPLLADYRDLRGAERRAVDEHTAACATCARTLAEYQAMDVGIQGLRDAPADPRLRQRYEAALSEKVAPPRRAPQRRALPYALAAVAVTLVLVVGVWTLLRPTGPGGLPRVAQQDIPAAKSAEVGAFVWQTDGVYGYRMLRPAGWAVTDAGASRDYISPALEGQPSSILHVVNLRAKVWGDVSEGLADALQAFESAPTLDGWTVTLRKDQNVLGGRVQLVTRDDSVRVFYDDAGDPDDLRLMLIALKVSGGQPLVMALETAFAPTEYRAVESSGLLDDFLVMASSLAAEPIDVANVAPWAPTATPTSPMPRVTPAPTAAPEAAVAPAPAPTFDPRLTIWPGWEQFEQALSRVAFGANTANPVCDWMVLGHNGNDIYVWAVCAARYAAAEAGAPNVSLASFPAVLRVRENNMTVGALKPGDGAAHEEDLKTLFPPAVQQQIADQVYVGQYPALEAHARLRLNWPMLPPFGAAEVAPADPDALGAKASVRIFSGREDPAWMFTHRELDQLDALLRELNTIPCPPIPDRLGYRGAQAILGPGDAGMLVAAEGTVWAGDAASNPDALCLADPQRTVERLLLSSSQPYVDADTFNLISTLLPKPLPTPLVSPTPTPTLAPGWAAYGDEGLDIQFKHPETWEITTRTPWSLVYGEKAAPPQGEAPMPPPPFWVTVLLPNFDNADASAYNFWSPKEVNQAWDTSVSETFVSPHAPEGYNTYTRLADVTVDGFPAALVENRNVWETPSETKDARVLVRVGGITVVFGSYYRSEEDYAAFMRVLESVKFGSAITKNGAFALTPEAPQPAPTAAPAAVPAASAARIVFEAKSATGEDLFSINPDGSDLRQITHGPGLNQEPACAPDGTRLAFTSWRDNTHSLYTVNADGAGERLVSDGPGNLAMPAWSPDSVRLVFRSDAVSALYVLTPGGAQEKLPILDDHLYAPAWSPDGRRLAYEVFDGQKADIRIANLDGSDDINLTPGFGFAHQPAWSPDGRQIAFHGHPTGGNTSEIYVMAADEQGRFTPGAEIRCLTCDANTDSRGNKYRPAWSPDGKQIAFHRKDGDGFDIWLMNADGSNPTQLTDGLDASNPCWIR